jgi:hypothetical protein
VWCCSASKSGWLVSSKAMRAEPAWLCRPGLQQLRGTKPFHCVQLHAAVEPMSCSTNLTARADCHSRECGLLM